MSVFLQLGSLRTFNSSNRQSQTLCIDTMAPRFLLVITVLILSHQPHLAHGEPSLECFDGPFESVLLDGCVDDCRSFETLEEAEQHCNALADCGGITKTAYGDSEAISLGVGLYEVRSGPGIQQQVGDTTWIKQDGCGNQGGRGSYGNGEYAGDSQRISGYDRAERWNESLEAVSDGYSRAVSQMFWMALFLCFCAALVFVSYRRGDQFTVDFVDNARERIKTFVQKRGPRINSGDGSYQSI